MIEDPVKDSSEVIPFIYSITSYGADYPVDALVKRLNSEDVYIPPFQRDYIWTLRQASRFIESLLLGLPVPGIFLAREGDSQKLLVIDGHQRLRTLQFFYNVDFKEKGKGFSLMGVQKQFEGKNYKTLSESDRIKLDDSIIHATVVKQEEPSEDQSSIYHIFERLNTGGSLLQPQEIRSCIYYGEFNGLLNELNENEKWRSIYGKPSVRLKDRELILRFFALYFGLNEYKRPMKNFLNSYMGKNRELKINSKEELTTIFNNSIDIIYESMGNKSFRPVKAINAAVYDAVIVGIATRLSNGKIEDLEAIKEKYESLLSEPEFQEAYKTNTSDEKVVKGRINLAINAFKDVQ
jgi:uncharacterized protein with ParB-like and HNH nuclease domain